MENKKLSTAVQWLLSELQIRLLIIKSEPDGIVRETMINNFLLDTEQSKEMEKQQIIDAYETAMETDIYNVPLKVGEQYYNETFKAK